MRWLAIAVLLAGCHDFEALSRGLGDAPDQGVPQLDGGEPKDGGGGTVDLSDQGSGPTDLACGPPALPPFVPDGGSSVTGFGAPTKLTATGTNNRLALADFNNDQVLDIIVISPGTNEVNVFLGDSTGAFGLALPATVGVSPRGMAVVDLDGDHKLDVVTANSGGTNLTVLHGKGDGTFDTPAGSITVGDGPHDVAALDLNGDAAPDLVTVRPNATSGNLAVLLNDGSGKFGTPTAYSASGSFLERLYAVDVDGDCRADVVALDQASGAVWVYLPGSGGTLQAVRKFPVESGPSDLVAGDFNRDGRVDLLVNSGNVASVVLLAGSKTALFGLAKSIPVSGSVFSMAGGDFNGDGALDVVAAETSSLHLLLGDGAGGFKDRAGQLIGEIDALAATRLRPNGKLDAIGANNVASEVLLFSNSSN